MTKSVGFLAARIGAALLSLLVSVAPSAAAADRITMRFEIYGLMGLHVLTLRTQLERNGDNYVMSADYATAGVAGMVVEQTTQAVARGRLTPGSAHPESFRNRTRRNGVDRHSQIDYRPDGTLASTSTPVPPNPVTSAEMRGTVDNLTAYLRLERQLAANRSCGLTVPVFDGRLRYDLAFGGGQQQALTPEGGQRFSGTAITCSMARHNRSSQDGEESEGAQQGVLWYAPLIPDGDVFVPVRMRLRTQIGTVDAYLAELHAHGVDLQLME